MIEQITQIIAASKYLTVEERVEAIIQMQCKEIEKVENPYDDEIGWHSEQEAFEEACVKILSLLKDGTDTR